MRIGPLVVVILERLDVAARSSICLLGRDPSVARYRAHQVPPRFLPRRGLAQRFHLAQPGLKRDRRLHQEGSDQRELRRVWGSGVEVRIWEGPLRLLLREGGVADRNRLGCERASDTWFLLG